MRRVLMNMIKDRGVLSRETSQIRTSSRTMEVSSLCNTNVKNNFTAKSQVSHTCQRDAVML